MRMIKSFLLFILALAFVGCARMGAPSGGPEDKHPPELVSTIPADGAVNVDTSVVVSILFDDHVQRTTLAPAFSMSPPPLGGVRAKWRGEQVDLTFDPPLLPDKTYAISIGSQLSDFRRNTLKEPIHFAFSTGDKLDVAKLNGFFKLDEKVAGWNLIGYRLAEAFDADSSEWIVPDPSVDLPDAATQVAENGEWNLFNLKPGRWRVFAFKDSDGDRLWTPWRESIAIPSMDLEASEDSTFVSKRLSLQPRIVEKQPRPVGVFAKVRNILNVRLNGEPREVDGWYNLVDPVPDTTGKYEDVVFHPEDKDIRVQSWKKSPEDSSVVRLKLDAVPASDVVWLRIRSKFGFDELVDTTLAISLKNVSAVDSFPPSVLKATPASGQRMFSGHSDVKILFDESMSRSQVGGIQLITADKDTVVPDFEWRGSEKLLIKLQPSEKSGRTSIILEGDSLKDLSGNTVLDSILTYSYTWLTADSLGQMSGTVEGVAKTGGLHLTLRPVNPGDDPIKFVMKGTREFSLDKVPSGRWVPEVWWDRDMNNKWTAGEAIPFVPADPFIVSTDTIYVRARWETGAVFIIFP